jgi:hypothetical protein
MKHVFDLKLDDGCYIGAVLNHRVYSHRRFIIFGKRKLVAEINYYCVNYSRIGAEWIADNCNIHTLRNDEEINKVLKNEQ